MYRVKSYHSEVEYEGPIYDTAEWLNGTSFKNSERANEGIPIIKIAELKDNITAKTEFYSGNEKDKYILNKDDLLYSWSGNPETSLDAYFFKLNEGILNQHIFKISPKKFTSKEYFFYLLNYLKPTLTRIARDKQTTGLGHVTISDLKELIIQIPSIETQKSILSILEPISQKIELNQKMNQTLEEIAKAIFKSWFVDFDPVRAKVEGRPTGLSPEISDLFPDELVDSEIGEIPKGWSVGAIVDFASLNKKTINPSQSTEIYEHFSIPAFDSGQSPVLDLGTDIKSNKTLVPEGSLLVSKLNPNTPRVWLPNPKDLHEQICSTEFMVYTATDHSNIAFLWGLFTSSLVAGRMEAMVTGTSKSHQRVKPNDVSSIMTVTPDARLVKTYGDTVLPMLNRTLVGKSESTVLSKLRDTLLPKLISGELRIPDAEKFLEEAGI